MLYQRLQLPNMVLWPVANIEPGSTIVPAGTEISHGPIPHAVVHICYSTWDNILMYRLHPWMEYVVLIHGILHGGIPPITWAKMHQ